jgi:hypothetical protein
MTPEFRLRCDRTGHVEGVSWRASLQWTEARDGRPSRQGKGEPMSDHVGEQRLRALLVEQRRRRPCSRSSRPFMIGRISGQRSCRRASTYASRRRRTTTCRQRGSFNETRR